MKYLMSAVLGIILSASVAFGAQTACPQHFADGQAPELISSLLPKTREICYNEFGVKHSGVTRTPLYSAEHLNPLRLDEASDMERENSFHPEPKIPLSERAELKDYKAKLGSQHFDRGHMAPNADFSNADSQYECFTLANMAPQHPNNNRGIWARIEKGVRGYVKRTKHTIFVVTIPVFGNNPPMLNGRVAIPVQIAKAIYDPITKQTGVYLTDNKAGTAYRPISVTQLKALTGIDAFPSLPLAIKGTCMDLPRP